ncbi:MAG: hypothetical protein OEW40_08285 [Cyclobacteriaceae bacterium]|nr:hypothetical protein [Cyclobacteriaceae bacterium]
MSGFRLIRISTGMIFGHLSVMMAVMSEAGFGIILPVRIFYYLIRSCSLSRY